MKTNSINRNWASNAPYPKKLDIFGPDGRGFFVPVSSEGTVVFHQSMIGEPTTLTYEYKKNGQAQRATVYHDWYRPLNPTDLAMARLNETPLPEPITLERWCTTTYPPQIAAVGLFYGQGNYELFNKLIDPDYDIHSSSGMARYKSELVEAVTIATRNDLLDLMLYGRTYVPPTTTTLPVHSSPR